MLQNIGDKLKGEGGSRGGRWVWYVILGALAIVFMFWGPYAMVDLSFGQAAVVAKVNGEKIPAVELNNQWQQQLPQIMEVLGGELTPERRAELQQQMIDIAVRELAVTQRARKLGFGISDEKARRAFREEPAFQVDGRFSIIEARARLANLGVTEDAYVRETRNRLLTNEYLGVIGTTDFLTPAEAGRLLNLLDEERQIRFALLEPERYAGSEPPAADAIQAYYASHQDDFAIPESVRLAYAELVLTDIAASVTVTEDEVRARYDQDKAQYVQAETRNARHILITVDDQAQDAAQLAVARGLYTQIQGGADFAEIARTQSQDSASAPSGGELGWATRDIYDPAFATKLFSMREGEVSEPVRSAFGYHIIKLEGIRPESGRSFESVRDELALTMRDEKAGGLFNTEQDRLQQELEGAGANLDDLARQFTLRRGEIETFERGAGGLPLGSDAALNREVFSDALVTQRRVGGPVQLSEDRVTIFQVRDHRPAATRPLEEVRGEIVTALLRERGAEAALKVAQGALNDLTAGRNFDAVVAALKLKPEPAKYYARQAPDLPVEVRDAVFAAPRPAPASPFRQALKLEDGNVALVVATDSRAGEALDVPQLVDMRTRRELERYTRRDIEAYIRAILAGSKIREYPAAFVE
jgi:peptidyl-prolyl cis-trans isomerase D